MHQAMYVKDQGGYIYFSKNTMGACGKPVKIHTSIFMDFYCTVDQSTADGQKVIRDVENLRNNPNAYKTGHELPKPRNSDPVHYNRIKGIRETLRDMKEGTLVTANVRVYFHLIQKPGDPCPTVYISEVKVKAGSDQEFGLFEQKRSLKGESLEPMSNRNLRDKTVFVSGVHDSKDQAFEAAKNMTSKTKAVLFYNPPSVAEDLGVWKINRLSDTTRSAIQELKHTLQENQKNKVDWFVEGEGAAVLSRAIEMLPGNLEQHNFTFINSKANTPRLLQQLGEKKAQFKGDVIRYTGDRSALLALADQKDQLNKQIGKLPGNVGYDRITRRYLADQIEGLGRVGSSNGALATKGTLRGSNMTFVDALNGVRAK